MRHFEAIRKARCRSYADVAGVVQPQPVLRHAVVGAVTDGSYVCPQGEICDQDQAQTGVDNSYGYDANGNQTSRIINGQSYTLGYDAEGHLVSVSGPSLSASFVYDGDGRRVVQTINGETTYFVGNYYEQTGTAITKYYYAGSQRVAMRAGSTVYYLLTDHLGSTSLTTDESGSVMSELRYTAWGSVRYQAGGTPTEYTYTGQYSDSYINLLDYGSRRYDPETGRFISADTIVPLASQGVQAWDRYAYVSNDPVRYNDPTGHCPTCLIGAGVGALVGGIAYGAYAAYTGNFNGWHLAAAIGGGALAGALIGSAVGAPAAAEVAATTAATVTGGGAAVLEATGGDPSDEIRVLEQTVQGTGQVVKDLIARSELIEKASNELVYQSPGGLNGAREVFNSLSGNVNEIVAKGGTILNKTLDSGGQVLFRTWSSVTRNLPSTPVLQFKDIPGFETLLKFHFPE